MKVFLKRSSRVSASISREMLRKLLTLAFYIASMNAAIHADSWECRSGSVHNRYNDAKVVFVGTAIRHDDLDQMRFYVHESFWGTKEQFITIQERRFPYPTPLFFQGRKYFVAAYEQDGKLSASPCTFVDIRLAGPDIEMLHRLKQGKRLPVVYGLAFRRSSSKPSDYFYPPHETFSPMQRARVIVFQSSRIVASTQTNVTGYFEFGNFKPGDYEIKVIPKSGEPLEGYIEFRKGDKGARVLVTNYISKR